MPFCDACGGWYYRTHECPPIWDTAVVLHGYTEEDLYWRPFHGRDAEEAAKRAAAEYDSEDYPLLKGHTVEVRVRAKTAISETLRFTCSGESLPHYYAVPIKDIDR